MSSVPDRQVLLKARGDKKINLSAWILTCMLRFSEASCSGGQKT